MNATFTDYNTGFSESFSGRGEFSSLQWNGYTGEYWYHIDPSGITTDGRCYVYNYSNTPTTEYNYLGAQFNSSNTSLSTSQQTSQQVTQQVSQQVTSNTQAITIGDFVLGYNTVVNTNTNTNTNVNTNTNTNTDYGYNRNVNTNTTYNYTTVNVYTPQYNVQTVYNVNESWIISPIVLDLSGTGKLDASAGSWLPHNEIRGNRLAKFDINGNNLEVVMEWVGPKAGLLIEPRADGTADGTCLFGTTGGYENGFEKLRLRDKNGDGVITGSEMNGLMVWVDDNGNGKVDKGELRSLASLQITSIGCNHTNFKSSFTMAGQKQAMWDWWPTALEVRAVKQVAGRPTK